MVAILAGATPLVASWVGNRIGVLFAPPCEALGVLQGEELIGGVVYDNYRDGWIEMHCAGQPGWLSKGRLAVLFSYPFQQLGCRGVLALVKAGNAPARRLIEGLGWQRPYTIPEGFEDDDMVLYTMLRRECRWIGGGDG